MEKYQVFNLGDYQIIVDANELEISISIQNKILSNCYTCNYTVYDFDIDRESDFSLNIINIFNMIKNGLLDRENSQIKIEKMNCRENEINLILNVDHEYIKFNYIFRLFFTPDKKN